MYCQMELSGPASGLETNGRTNARERNQAMRDLGMKEIRAEKIKTLRATAANLRDLAARGMSSRKFQKEADRLEEEARELESVTAQL